MSRLDISEIHSTNRLVTKTIARSLYDEGAAGIRFHSNKDNQPCSVVFEGRWRLAEAATGLALTEDVPELVQVCDEYALKLERVAIRKRNSPLLREGKGGREI